MYIRLAKLHRNPQLGLLESIVSSFLLSFSIGLSLVLLLIGVCLVVIILESVLPPE